jgi:hypothetical protein
VKAITSSAGKIVAINANASAFVLPAEQGVVEAAAKLPTVAEAPHLPVTWQVDGRTVLAPKSGAPQWALVDTSAAPKVAFIKSGETATLTAPAMGFEGGVLLPLSNGQVALANVLTGKALVLPFQPRLDAGEPPLWQAPLALSGATATFAIANARGQLFIVSRKEQPKPHLALVKQTDAGVVNGSSLAQLDDTVIAVVEKEGQYSLQPFAIADLSPGAPLALDSGIAFGPRSVGEVVLLATDGEGLHCIESGLKVRWKLPLGGAGVSGLATRGDELIIITTHGAILRLNAAGKELKRLETAAPLAGDPVIEDDKLWCPGVDGAVYALPLSALEE